MTPWIARAIFSAWLVAFANLAARSQAADVPTQELHSIKEIWTMSESERQAGARIEAEFLVVVYDSQWKVLWIQEGGETYYIRSIAGIPFKSGDFVRLTGQVKAGAPDILWPQAEIRVLKERAWPKPANLNESFAADRSVSRGWAELTGYVSHAMQVDDQHLLVKVKISGEIINLHVLTPKDDPRNGSVLDLPGSRISARGVYTVKRNPAGAITAHELWVPGAENIRTLNHVSDDPSFDLPLRPARTIRESAGPEAIRIRAAVKEQQPGRILVVTDGEELVTVEAWQASLVKPGALVDAVGIPRVRGTQLILGEGLYRPVDATNTVRTATIRLASEVRSMNPAEADTGQPVQLRGVVTFSHHPYPFIFFQDSSAGICVELAEEEREHPPEPGSAVVISGLTSAGDFAPWIRFARVERQGAMDLPSANPITLDHAMTGAEDSQWVQIEGFLRRVREDDGLTILDFATRSGEFSAHAENPDRWRPLVGAILKISGACGAVVNKQREISGIILWIPPTAGPEIVEPAPSDPFDAPLRSIESMRQFHAVSTRNRRILVSGTVTAHLPGRCVVIQQGGHGLNVLTRETLSLQIGEVVEAVGFVGSERTRLVLREAVLRTTGRLEKIEPGDFASSLEDFNDSTLVRSRSVLLDKNVKGKEMRLTLQSESGLLFDAVHDNASLEFFQRLKPLSLLEITGVGQLLPDEHGNPHSIRMLLRGQNDVAVLEQPPLLTIERAGTLLFLASAVALGLAGWTRFLQRKIKKQTAQMLLQLRHKASLQSQYRSLVENASDWIFTLCENGLFGSTNAAGESITGFSASETVALRLENLIHPGDKAGFTHPQQIPAMGQAATQQFRILRKDGTELWLELKSAPLREPGRAPEWLGIARDITARKLYEEQMRLAKEAAEANTRARGEFLANMSHEIRTPMNGVLGMCQLLLDTGLSAEQRDFADTIRTSSEALLTVINDILDLSKIEAGKLELESLDFNLRDEVESVMELLAVRAARKPIEISAFIHPEIPCLLCGDHGRLRQVLLNLAGNAIKFTEAGEVALSVTLDRQTDAEALLHFEIADTGIGIPEDVQSRLFQPFTRPTPPPPASSAAPASAWPSPAASSTAWGARSLCAARPAAAPPSRSPSHFKNNRDPNPRL